MKTSATRASIILLLLSGCASLYQPRVQTFHLPPTKMELAKGQTAGTQVTTYEQWTSLWSAICGAIVQYENGEPAQMMPGNCGTPLTLFMASPVNLGLAGVMVNRP